MKRTVPRNKFRRTISAELLAQWRNLARTNDALVLSELLQVSKPTIDKALIYGCVHQQRIVDGINKFLADRLMREKSEAAKLKELTT